ncbi:MAG: hypothetical protein IKJ68_10400 [Clostridia bacterium]|nr:hypothetical protein [Clostridia bacterium]
MFDNIGGKIKILAQVLCWLGVIASVICGFSIMVDSDDVGFLIVVIGPLVSWVSSFFLYGFGQLIENTDILVLNSKKPNSNKKSQHTKNFKAETYTEKDFLEDIRKETAKTQTPKDFFEEIKETQTSDLKLILEDQRELYTAEEIDFIENELSTRKDK